MQTKIITARISAFAWHLLCRATRNFAFSAICLLACAPLAEEAYASPNETPSADLELEVPTPMEEANLKDKPTKDDKKLTASDSPRKRMKKSSKKVAPVKPSPKKSEALCTVIEMSTEGAVKRERPCSEVEDHN